MSHHLCHPRQACAAFHVSEGEITAGSDGNHLQGIRDRLVRVKGHTGVWGRPRLCTPLGYFSSSPSLHQSLFGADLHGECGGVLVSV